jgi:flagellar FliJ protein
MKKFRFPLRSVATIRTLCELRAREQFSHAVQAFVTAEEKLQALRARLAELEQILRSGRAGTFRPSEEAWFMEAFRHETIAATKATNDVTAARGAMESARQAWLEARRDLRVLENLEQKARAAHRREGEREDQAALDDRTSGMIARNASNTL